MAHLATVASHTSTGVASCTRISCSARSSADFAELYPTASPTSRRFAVRRGSSSRTRGSRAVPSASGTPGRTTSRNSTPALGAEGPGVLLEVRRHTRREQAAASPSDPAARRVEVDPASLFDVQVKRIPRVQAPAAEPFFLHVVTATTRCAPTRARLVPRTVIFAGKAAPGYVMAKGIIKLINTSPAW